MDSRSADGIQRIGETQKESTTHHHNFAITLIAHQHPLLPSLIMFLDLDTSNTKVHPALLAKFPQFPSSGMQHALSFLALARSKQSA